MRTQLILTLLLILSSPLIGQTHKVSLLFAGDAMQHKNQLEDAKQANGSYDYSQYFAEVQEDVKAVDLAIVNLEVTLAGTPHTGYPTFSAPDEYALALKDAGFGMFVTANNHSADRRKKGIDRTIDVLNSLDIIHTGTFKDTLEREIYYPLMLLQDGIRIAMLNYTYGTNGIPVTAPNIVNIIDTVQIKKDIADAHKLGAHIIIANMHWGDEYVLKQNKTQERLANFLVDNGVHLVIGNHPHVVQPVDIRRRGDSIESIIVYSLGNYVSGMRTVNTSGGMTVRIDISKEPGEPVSIDAFDYSLVWTHKPKKNGVYTDFKLLPVDKFENEKGKEALGADYAEMESFAKAAREAIESMGAKKIYLVK